MTVLHTMSLAGSIAVAIYLLTYFLTKRYLPITWHKIYLAVNIALFIVPFGCFKAEYTAWLNKYLGFKAWYQKETVIKNATNFTVFVYKDGIYVSNLPVYIMLLVSLLLGVGGLIVFIKKYNAVYLKLMKGVVRFERGEMMLKELEEETKRHTKCGVYLCTGIRTPITIGIMCKRIILPDMVWEEEKLRDVLHHELVHIKVMDNLIKVILLFVVFLNFYNPFVYYLMYRWNLTAEMYCDNRVTAQKSIQERKEYAKLIIDFAEMERNIGLPIVGLSMNQKQIKERIENMKKTGKKCGKISKVIGLLIIAVTVFTSSLTVYAYEKRQIKHPHTEQYEKVEDIFWYDNQEDAIFVKPFTEYDAYEQYINADNITFFVSETGEVYYDICIEQEGHQTYRSCSHTYVSGIIEQHVKNSSGGCKVDVYDGKRCNKCGDIVYGVHVKSVSYDICPH